MKVQKLIILSLIVLLVSDCIGVESKFNCFGASSPADLTMINDGNSDLIISLFEHSNETGYNLIGTVKISPYEEKTICLENEGPIVDGLYIYYYDKTLKIKLSSSEKFVLNLSDSNYFIPTIKELEYLRDSK